MFRIYRETTRPDWFVVTDAREGAPPPIAEVTGLEGLEFVGEYPELGPSRVAFNELLAKDAIWNQHYYRFKSNSFDPVAEMPATMPG
jgi:hypothetical protein